MTPTLAELRAFAADPWTHLFLGAAVVLSVAGALTTSAAFLSGLLLAVCAAVVTARDLHEGAVADTLTRSPDRARLLLARISAPVLLTTVCTAVLTLVTRGIGPQSTAAVVDAPVVALLTTQGVCLGLLSRRPAVAVPVVLALWFVAPTVLRALGVYLGAADALGWMSPVGLAAEAAGWSPLPADDRTWRDGVRGATGLLVWTAALLAGTWGWLKGHDFGRTP